MAKGAAAAAAAKSKEQSEIDARRLRLGLLRGGSVRPTNLGRSGLPEEEELDPPSRSGRSGQDFYEEMIGRDRERKGK